MPPRIIGHITINGQRFDVEASEAFYNKELELNDHVYGLAEDSTGSLDSENGAIGHNQDTDQYLDKGGANEVTAADVKDGVTKKHNPGGNHTQLMQAGDLTDDAPSSVLVTNSDVSAAPGSYNSTWGGEVVTLANEMKDDINTLRLFFCLHQNSLIPTIHSSDLQNDTP